jgi:hypothetical protein
MAIIATIAAYNVAIRFLVAIRAGSGNGIVIHPDLTPPGDDVTVVAGVAALNMTVRLLVTTGAGRCNTGMIYAGRFPGVSGMALTALGGGLDMAAGLFAGMAVGADGACQGIMVHPDLAPLGGDVAVVAGVSRLDMIVRLLVAA